MALLTATRHQLRTVGAFVDNLIDDHVSLLPVSLTDTFSDKLYNKRPQTVSSGFCMEL
jgi:hypothetical protein